MIRFIVACLLVLTATAPVAAQQADTPLRIAVAGLTHGHVAGLLGRQTHDVEIVGIYEPDHVVAARYVRDYKLNPSLIHDRLDAMLDATKPEAVVAFGPVADHRKVVEAAAPRHLAIMVEKPLAFDAREADAMAALARRYGVPLLTNYETTWYPSRTALGGVLASGVVGSLRKAVFRDGHWGPKEIGVQPEFLRWLVDPAANGGGAIVDFGCYGANLMTWLMGNEAPLSVTAVAQHLKTDPVYAHVDDEATLILTYPHATAIIEASWNWPDNRKDIQVFGERGLLATPNGDTLVVRLRGEKADRKLPTPALTPAFGDSLAYLTAVIRGRASAIATDPSSLANALVVARILDAARRSAATGRTIALGKG